MSKRMLVLITILMLLLAVFSVAQAQQPTYGEPIFTLSEDQIAAGFRIPSNSTRRISNLEVDMQDDGAHISFQMTTIKDGTTNTMSIIAILIGLFNQPRVLSLELENTLITNYNFSASQRREVTNLIVSAWRSYARRAFAGVDVSADQIELLMDEEGILIYAVAP